MSHDKPSDHHNNPRSKQSVSGEIKVSGSLEVFETERAIKQHKTEEENSNSYKEATKKHENSSLVVTRVTAGVTTLYLIFTILIFIESKRSADAAKDSAVTAATALKVDQRAWITMSDTPPTPKVNEPIVAAIQFLNSGRTIAKPIDYRFDIEIPKTEEEPLLNFTSESKLHTAGFLGYIPPNSQNSFTPVIKLAGKDKPDIFSEPIVKDLENGDRYLVVYGEAEYQDIFGEWHWTRYCSWHEFTKKSSTTIKKFSSAKCVAYTNIGDGRIPKRIPEK